MVNLGAMRDNESPRSDMLLFKKSHLNYEDDKVGISAIILSIASYVIIQVPSVQDRIMVSVVSGMANTFGK